MLINDLMILTAGHIAKKSGNTLQTARAVDAPLLN
jgi:hypothetical protein